MTHDTRRFPPSPYKGIVDSLATIATIQALAVIAAIAAMALGDIDCL